MFRYEVFTFGTSKNPTVRITFFVFGIYSNSLWHLLVEKNTQWDCHTVSDSNGNSNVLEVQSIIESG
jgi:hypothetical protein